MWAHWPLWVPDIPEFYVLSRHISYNMCFCMFALSIALHFRDTQHQSGKVVICGAAMHPLVGQRGVRRSNMILYELDLACQTRALLFSFSNNR